MSEEPRILPHPGETILSVSELNRLAREALESAFPLLWVGGEVSNLRRPASGHVYFALKDEGAQVDCVMFRNRAQLLPFRLQDGQRVEARALVTLYEARGGFQLNIESMRHAGIGALFEAFARLRDRLEKEGLFAPERRLPLPRFPRRIGIVTSLQAAALRDVLSALARRAPHVPVTIYPTPVQGEGAAANIADALRSTAQAGGCDVLIVCRGGGSIEDLWAFNEEAVARAIDASPIPVVSGIGHESDTTIADLAADCRAATPTAAAELVSTGYVEAALELAQLVETLAATLQRGLRARMQRLDLMSHRLIHPGAHLQRLRTETALLASRLCSVLRQRFSAGTLALHRLQARFALCRPDLRHPRRDLDSLASRLAAAAAAGIGRRRDLLVRLAASLDHLSPQAVLKRGFSLVRKPDGSIVRASAQLARGDAVRLTFAEGEADAQISRLDGA